MTGPLVLVADDSATSRLVIEKQLKQLGCRVAMAENGTSALAAILQQRFDLVLLDCFMPDINGDEVARRVREEEGLRDIGYTPLIGISAEADAAHVQLCLASGMDGILGKPLPMGEFKTMLELWCDYDDAEGADTPTTPLPTREELQAVDLTALFIKTSEEDLQAMRMALNAPNLTEVKLLAHRIKGAALTMGKNALAGKMQSIEMAATDNAPDALIRIESLMAESTLMLASAGHGA